MHPAVVLIPIGALVLGPRIWVSHVLKQHNRDDEDLPGSAKNLAREWLDSQQLQRVKVEITDMGDHYDPEAKSVRLARDKYDRKSLTAVTTAAHEVSHALQDAADYAPFVWRMRLAKLAMAAGQVGTVILLAVPAAAMFARRPIPPALIGSTLVVMLGTGLVLQLASLQSELDASFKRALPLLQDGVIEGIQIRDARKILFACSLTYVASSLLSMLNIWPWLGRGGALSTQLVQPEFISWASNPQQKNSQAESSQLQVSRAGKVSYAASSMGTADKLMRKLGKPLIRTLFQVKRRLAG